MSSGVVSVRRERPFSGILVGVIVCSLVLGHVKIAQGTDVNPSDGIVRGVWRIVDSPFHVKRDIAVPTDESLTIEPGVTVYFDGYYGLTVQGRLVASGTHGNRITFSWKDGGTDRDKWLGIYIYSTTRASSITYCVIMNAITAIGVYGSLNNVLTFNTIRYNTGGIFMVSAEGTTVTDNEIYENSDYGISLSQGCKRNEISRNTVYKIGRPLDGLMLSAADSRAGWLPALLPDAIYNVFSLRTDLPLSVEGTACIKVEALTTATPLWYFDAQGSWDLSGMIYINFYALRKYATGSGGSGFFQIWEGPRWRSWDTITWPGGTYLQPVLIRLNVWTSQSPAPPDTTKIDRLRFGVSGTQSGDTAWVDFVTSVGSVRGEGIRLTGSSGTVNVDNKIKDNTIRDCHFSGISLDHVENIEISGNLVYANCQKGYNLTGGGILLRQVNDRLLTYENKNVLISNNRLHTAYRSGTGIFIQNGTDVRITSNDIYLNSYAGIVAAPGANLIQAHYNDIRNNGKAQAIDDGTTNRWDDASRGNYWSDYTGSDRDNNGIGDSPYVLNGTKISKDNFPLMSPTLFIAKTYTSSTTLTSTRISTSYILTTTGIETTRTTVTTTLHVTSPSYIWTASTGTTSVMHDTLTTSTSTTVTTVTTSTSLATTSLTSSTTTTVTTTLVHTVTPRRCFIASAAYGSELVPEVQRLREFRDTAIISSFSGASFMRLFDSFYYSFSPSIANAVSSSPTLAGMVRVTLYPLIEILRFASVVGAVSELGVVAAGSTASALVGAVYGAPILIVSYMLGRLRRRGIFSGGSERFVRPARVLAGGRYWLLQLRNYSLTKKAVARALPRLHVARRPW